MSDIILEAKNICKHFAGNTGEPVLSDINFTVKKGEFVSLMGKSGCGKSTLLYILSTMDTDYDGELYIDGERLTGSRAARLAEVRNEKIGFVFQFHYLLNEFTVLKNVMLPALKLGRLSEKEIEEKATRWLQELGVEHVKLKHPKTLSGGEKQRVAIARALINDPHIIMGDEPTGNLDKKNSAVVFDIFKRLSMQYGQTLFIVTHDPEFATQTQRIIEMEDGRIKTQ
ncbi:MAG: ABC transporter ATP-binding protein [Chitinophagaceae bacterium]|nr:MAG: ABC transporter ATP-binding protein [Chitinophagaceae bacterium]